MRNLLKAVLLIMIMIFCFGCSAGKLSKLEKKSQQNSDLLNGLKELIDMVDRNSAKVKETEVELEQINKKLTDLENRISIAQTGENAEMQEIKENISFVSDQLARIDKTVQTRRSRPLPAGTSAFKPGGFDVSTSYNSALTDYRAKRYEAAISGFKEVLSVSPTSTLADNAQYWIGECYDAMGNYENALSAFNNVFDYPKSNKYPDAQVKIGLIYVKLDKTDLAKNEFKAVIDNYPGTNAASIAASQLEKLGE
ncbi:MAG TPA: tol-pal system protein YbgF [bacterium]|nr:tol-pal system protein YbgF [bacterium]